MKEVGLATEPDDVRERLEDVPPSARHIYQVLRDADGLSRAELEDATLHSRNTVYRAVRTLEELDLVWHGARDARRRAWYTADSEQTPTQNGHQGTRL